jgi:hypothetical protein
VVVLEPNVGIGLTVILDDVVGHPKMPGEARVVHVAPEHLGSWPLGAKAMPFSITVPTVALVAHAVLGVHPFISPREPDGVPLVQEVHSGGPHW